MIHEGSCYELVSLLGEGGMGRVYRAIHHPSGEQVAIKTLHAHLGDVDSRHVLLREAAAAARLRHPHIVRLIDVFEDERQSPVLVMELVPGDNVAQWLAPWPGWQRISDVFEQVLDGLCAAHAAGVVHRDLKPENLLRDPGGHVKIVDFGVAEVLQPLRRDEERRRLAGTPLYMAPEQFDAASDLGPFTDLYAVGVMLYELVFGLPPHRGDLHTMVAAKRLGSLPERAIRPGLQLPPSVPALIRALLAPDPRQRPRFAAQVRRVLSDAADGASDEVGVHDAARSTLEVPSGREADSCSGDTLLALDTERGGAGRTMPAPHVKIVVTTPPLLPTRLPAPPRLAGAGLARLRAPAFVGRKEERAHVEKTARSVILGGGPHVVCVFGDAGAGKSALARHWLGEVERRALMLGAAAGYDLAGGDAGGLRHAVRRLLGPPARGARDSSAPPDWPWVDTSSVDADTLRHLARWIADGTCATGDGPALALQALRLVSAVRPVYLWLDDFGWSRDGALELVEALLDVPELPVLVVATSRAGTIEHPALRARIAGLLARERVSRLDLRPLDARERAELVREVLPLSPGLALEIAGQSTDTPLLLLERANDWLEQGLLRESGGGWVLREGLDVPGLLAAEHVGPLLDRRIEHLLAGFEESRDTAEEILLRAALLGVIFEERELRAAVSDTPAAEHVDAFVDQAMLQGLLVRIDGGRAYRFEHALLRDRAEERLAGHPRRAELALDVVRALRALHAQARSDLGARLAPLLRLAGRLDEAVLVACEAIRGIGRSGESARAHELADEVDRWLDAASRPADDVQRGHLHRARAGTCYFAMDYPAAEEALSRATAIAERHGDPVMIAGCLLLEAHLAFYQDRHGEAARVARAALDLLPPRLGPYDVWVRHGGRHVLMEVAAARGDFEEALRVAALRASDPDEPPGSWGSRLTRLAAPDFQLLLGLTEQAELSLRELAAEAEAAGDWAVRDECLDMQLRADVLASRWEPALSRVAARLPWATSRGDAWRETAFRIIEATCLAHTADAAKVAPSVEAMLEAFARAPHDEAFSHRTLERLAERLRVGDLPALGARVAALLRGRRAALARGLSDG